MQIPAQKENKYEKQDNIIVKSKFQQQHTLMIVKWMISKTKIQNNDYNKEDSNV